MACLAKLCRDTAAINMDLDSTDSGTGMSWERLANVSALSLVHATGHSASRQGAGMQ
jgi:hypothetical protein